MADMTPHPATVSEICDALGRKAVAARVGRSIQAVSNAATDGVFPASWYLAVKSMCGDAGIGCPEHLFSFVPAADVAKTGEDAA